MTQVCMQKDQVSGLRVRYIISSFRPLIGGAERVTEDILGELLRLGAKVCPYTISTWTCALRAHP